MITSDHFTPSKPIFISSNFIGKFIPESIGILMYDHLYQRYPNIDKCIHQTDKNSRQCSNDRTNIVRSQYCIEIELLHRGIKPDFIVAEPTSSEFGIRKIFLDIDIYVFNFEPHMLKESRKSAMNNLIKEMRKINIKLIDL